MATAASEEFRNDGALVNALTGLGVPAKDKTAATKVGFQLLLTEAELESLYTSGIPRRYVDAIADEILRHRPTITLGGDSEDGASDLITNFEQFLQATQFAFALSEVIKLQRLYGGAGLVLLIDDGGQPDEPVELNRIRAVRGYVPLSRHELIPEDVSITDYSRPSHYRITTAQRITPDQTSGYVNLRIHHTRVARFDGLYLPWNQRARNTGWGQSVLQLIWNAFKRYETAMSGLESMTSDSDVFVHKIPGLFNRIAAGNEADLRKRLEANNLSRSVYGGMVVDVEEEISFINRALSNIATATDPFIKDLQAATGWPASILMGDSPGGLGKEGRYEERVWSSLVEQWQEVYCRTAITEVFTYILASREGPTRGRIPESWSVHFPSVFTQTDKEKAELHQLKAASDVQYIQMGVLNALEVREARFGGTEYSLETQLNEAITEQLIATTDAQFQSQMAGYDAQLQAATQPPALPEGEGAAPPAEEGASTAVLPPADAGRGDALYADADGLRIAITHRRGDVVAGPLVGPDGQRIDSSAAAPVLILGPHRTRARKLYRARFALDSTITDGPYTTGFNSLRAAKAAVQHFFPGQNVAGLSAVPDAEADAFRAYNEGY
jgi:phage-related protein (TIGR01555 family)